MSFSAHKTEEQLEEHFDEEDRLNECAVQVAELIRQAKHMVVFTGAGISTGAGIPDYRGPQGVWTLAAQGKERAEPTVEMVKAVPTATHMALVALQEEGILKQIISQNCDGLHRKSGIRPDMICELHGNSNLEKCAKCGKEYLRDFDATASYEHSVFDHRTGRDCVVKGCGGGLSDTIINFGENLPRDVLSHAWEQTEKADLFLVLGSSLTVSPACHMPEHVGKKSSANLVINNLQKTPLGKVATLEVFGKCEVFMTKVMAELGIEIPSFVVRRRVIIEHNLNDATVEVLPIDLDGTSATIFLEVSHGNVIRNLRDLLKFDVVESTGSIRIECNPIGHYREPSFSIDIDLDGRTNFETETTHQYIFDCIYDLEYGWDVTQSDIVGEIIDQYEGNNFDVPEGTDLLDKSNCPINEMFSVQPRTDCPHGEYVQDLTSISDQFKQNSCKTCEDSSENWYCCTCGKTFCSRYVNGHGKEHFEQTGHCIAVSYSDLSCWCYKCSDYIVSEKSSQIIYKLHYEKFNTHHARDTGEMMIGTYLCNICFTPISGVRYHCQTCPDFDICDSCNTINNHDESHMISTH